jgi:hypothetical protein
MLATIGVHALRTRGRALRDLDVFFPELVGAGAARDPRDVLLRRAAQAER